MSATSVRLDMPDGTATDALAYAAGVRAAHNARTGLDVDVNLVDERGARWGNVRTGERALLARRYRSRGVTHTLSGGLGAIGQQAWSLYSRLPPGRVRRPARQAAGFLRSDDGRSSCRHAADPGEVRADIQFADEVGDLWQTTFRRVSRARASARVGVDTSLFGMASASGGQHSSCGLD